MLSCIIGDSTQLRPIGGADERLFEHLEGSDNGGADADVVDRSVD